MASLSCTGSVAWGGRSLGALGVGEIGDRCLAAEVAGVAVEGVEADLLVGEAEVFVAGAIGGLSAVYDGSVELVALVGGEFFVEGGFGFEFFYWI